MFKTFSIKKETIKGMSAKFLLTLIVLTVLMPSLPTLANDPPANGKTLVLYSTQNGEINEYIRMLDLLVGSSEAAAEYININRMEKNDLDNVTHLIYYGFEKNLISSASLNLIKQFKGPMFTIGHNVEQFTEHYSFIELENEFILSTYLDNDGITKTHSPSNGEAYHFRMEKETETLAKGMQSNNSTTHPILVKNKENYYFSVIRLSYAESLVIGDALKEFLGIEEANSRPAYIRLEDVHPLVDPEKLEATGEILAENNIPYMIAVIPVYTNPESGKETYFSDSPKLLKVLKEMQKNGGSIVLHGYTHQFRKSETGEGFEFWDVENDRPIYTSGDDESFIMKDKSDFNSIKEYNTYMEGLKAFESEYIRKRLTRGIQELANYGLYPLAFEAPHYTMSQNGYHTVAEFFNTYVGQIQLSDENWETMDSSPFITKSSLLGGLEILPETLGYLPEGEPNALLKMEENAAKIQLTQDGIASAFYHPYLGADGLKKVINIMESIPNMEWIDLKDRNITVKAENVSITTESGQIITDVQRASLFMTSIDFPMYHLHNSIRFISWVIAIAASFAVLVFIYLISIRMANTRIKEG